ncbi:MAG: hypothetical protein J6S89_02410 [Paludibacteraceae bacterium]|nr:hypothetical protein [Paludibacteraceae bacterium]
MMVLVPVIAIRPPPNPLPSSTRFLSSIGYGTIDIARCVCPIGALS